MKFSIFAIVLMPFLFFSCEAKDTNDLPIILNKAYNFQINEKSKHFAPERSKRITFFQNGTYKRTEDTGTPFFWPSSMAIQITNLQGDWTVEGKDLILNDREIVEFHCYADDGAEIDCEITVDLIPIGRSEWFMNFRLKSKTEDYLLIQAPFYLNK
jgi:hypothetical protein